MNKKFAIFDMDGTLVDSMNLWKSLGREYLEAKGVSCDIEDVLNRIKPMTMMESAALFAEEFHLPQTLKEVAEEMNGIMEAHYRSDIPLKPDVQAYLERLRKEGVVMCVASATAGELMEVCLKRLGVADYFAFLLSCEEAGAGKSQPYVYHMAAGRLGASPEEIAVYEDALYAAKTAKAAGYYVVGVYDPWGESDWQELEELADEVIHDFRL